MSKTAVEIQFASQSSYSYGVVPYTASQMGLGNLMYKSTGPLPTDKWVGPLPISIIRPAEYTTAIPAVYPWATRWSSTLDWVFLVDNATAASNRRLVMASYNRSNSEFNIEGFISMSLPITGSHTVRAMRMSYVTQSSGQVWGFSGTNEISGSGTLFTSSCVCAGNRIGFGSSDPTQISSWYEIREILDDSTLRLNSLLGSTINTSSYVIEDLRCIMVTTNALSTVAGGIFIAKGLRKDIFSPTGHFIGSASISDNSRSVYWLTDDATLTNTASIGAGIADYINPTTQYMYVVNGVNNPTLFKYNIRKPLFLTAGRDTGSLILKTDTGGLLTGVASQANNTRLATLGHGPGSGSACIYFTTTTRIYRTGNVDNIISGSNSWISDNAVENPPGGALTYAASSLMNSLEHMSTIDKLVVCVNGSSVAHKNYVTQFRTDSGQFDRGFGVDSRQYDITTAPLTDLAIHPSHTSTIFSLWCEGGIAYMAGIGTTNITNRVYAIPLGADWEYASTTNCRILSPEISTPLCNKYSRVYMNEVRTIGETTGQCKGSSTEDYRIYYRTAGISDDSGTWNSVGYTGDLSGVSGADSIQFMFEFKTMGLQCIPARLLGLTIVYEDLTTDSHYQPSVAHSDTTNKRFAWRFATAFGSSVPALRVRLYDAVSSGLLVDDNTEDPTGTFEKSVNSGSSWSSYDDSDKANNATYIRYTPAALGDNIKVRPVLTLN
jgi:hypothetical protein